MSLAKRRKDRTWKLYYKDRHSLAECEEFLPLIKSFDARVSIVFLLDAKYIYFESSSRTRGFMVG